MINDILINSYHNYTLLLYFFWLRGKTVVKIIKKPKKLDKNTNFVKVN